MRLIDFVVVGVQKAGTTALHDYLSNDPAYGMAIAKEAHFFDDDSLNWKSPAYESYHAQFDWNRSLIRGEATPIYIYWPNCLERMAAYNPDMKIVVMLRDPVERAWSHWKMEAARGVESHDFSWCIREGRRRLQCRIPWGVDREISYVERGFYGEQLERLFGVFPPSQVLIIEADDLKQRPADPLARLNAFLGAPSPAATDRRSVHVGPASSASLSKHDIALMRELYAEDNARLHALTGISY
ncbi:sulfotransferase [Phenylobacterium sp.]|uniref:sulfotransferase family protein n=1 Tax=Phenylobacterium sp. TaxID=1871053 RepID=UPI0035B28AD6